MVYTGDMMYTVDTVYTVLTIHCLNISIYALIYDLIIILIGKVRTLLLSKSVKGTLYLKCKPISKSVVRLIRLVYPAVSYLFIPLTR